MAARSISTVLAAAVAAVAAVAVGGVLSACSTDAPSQKQSEASKVSPEAGIVATPPPCGSDTAPACPDSKPSYKADVAPILKTECNTCHIGGPTGPWPLTEYQDLLDWKLQLLGDMLHCTMPPEDAGHKLSDANRGTLIAWLACGAPNN